MESITIFPSHDLRPADIRMKDILFRNSLACLILCASVLVEMMKFRNQLGGAPDGKTGGSIRASLYTAKRSFSFFTA